jgi:hypothetical protein
MYRNGCGRLKIISVIIIVIMIATPTGIFSIVNPTRCSNFSNLLYFWNNALHVSDGLSAHHQEFKIVHTAAGICQTGTAVCLLASNLELLMMDRETVRNM